MTEGQRFFVFFAVWIALGIGSGLLLWLGTPHLKRTWYPRLIVLAGLLFVAFVYWVSPAMQPLFVLVPAITIITLLNLKISKFCPRCGAFFQDLGPLVSTNYCRKCGYSLKKPEGSST